MNAVQLSCSQVSRPVGVRLSHSSVSKETALKFDLENPSGRLFVRNYLAHRWDSLESFDSIDLFRLHVQDTVNLRELLRECCMHPLTQFYGCRKRDVDTVRRSGTHPWRAVFVVLLIPAN